MMYTVYDYGLLAPPTIKDEYPSAEPFQGTDPYVYLKKLSPRDNICLRDPAELTKRTPFIPLG